ncbi:MAG: ABC transporter permease [Bacteroidetes bacterium]|nr:ABC transporter permease [Bacteroidota bacterium]
MKPILPMSEFSKPPRWADRFLQWYCRPELLEEIQGDAYEIYYRDLKEKKIRADGRFIWNVIRFFRWRNIRKTRLEKYSTTTTDMIKSYLISGFRNMVRNSTPSLINIIGLSIAIGIAVTVFVLEDSFYHLDSMHTRADDIALVVNHIKDGDETYKSARSPHPLAEILKNNTAVEKVARAGRTVASVRVGELVFKERFVFADPEFMEIFDFRIISGDRNTLAHKDQIIVSEAIATKYFGNTDVVGQPMSIKFSEQHKYEFTIGGVLEDTPANSSMYIDILVSAPVWVEMNKDRINDWSLLLGSNFVLKKPQAAWSALSSDLDQFRKFQNEADATRPIQKVELLPLKEVAAASWDISGSMSWSNSPASMISLILIAAILTLIACFNYMNVAVASVTTRLKEIGIRKVIGGGKREIIFQFLLENLSLCAIALCVGTLLAYYLLVPGFNQMFPVKIEFGVSSWQMAMLFFGGFLLLVAILSGAYPSFYVASFSAIKVLKGKEKFGNKSVFSKSLLTMQFALSITSIVACLMFIAASHYFERLDWGYKHDEILVVELQNSHQYEEILSQVRLSKNISATAGAMRHIGYSEETTNITYEGKEYSTKLFGVGHQYLELMNIRLKAGRLLNESIASDKIESVVVNEKFVKKMGWADAVGQSFVCDSVKRFVVGVVEDFYYDDFYNPIEPVVFSLALQENFRYMVLHASSGKLLAAEGELKSIWKKVAPDEPTAVSFQSNAFQNFVRNSKANNKIMVFVAITSIILAAMGLYGLISYNLTRRLKEFSIRRVFGASVFEVFQLMSGDYLIIVVVAFIVGAPLGAWMMNIILASLYPTVIPLAMWPYVVAISLMTLMVGLTILSLFGKITRENPTNTLRVE